LAFPVAIVGCAHGQKYTGGYCAASGKEPWLQADCLGVNAVFNLVLLGVEHRELIGETLRRFTYFQL
jgi:hypothetical protein